MLGLRRVSKIWGGNTADRRVALNDLTLHLSKGDFLTVIGGNGSGKSTLLNVIAGVYSADDGQVIIDGTDVTALSEHKRANYLGRVFQDPLLGSAAHMTVEENLAIAAKRGGQRGLSWGLQKGRRADYRALLSQLDLGLENRLSSKVGLLSGGQRQALTLLMAAMNRPKLLLLDEHTAALDPKTAAKVLTLSGKIIAENNLTAIMVTHSMKDAIRYGNRLMMMEEGQIVYEASGQQKQDLTAAELLEKFHSASNLAAGM